MKVTFWGTRGSIPVPGPATARYGGNTPCVSIELGSELLVLDAGTGIRELGLSLRSRGFRGPVTVLLSHPHSDHVHGLPFFAPIHDPEARVRIFGPSAGAASLRNALFRLMTPPYWPEAYRKVAERLDVTGITAETLEIGNFRITATPLRHPGGTLGYSVASRNGGKSVNYLTDNELGDWNNQPEWQAPLVGFLQNGAVLIHDATYGDGEIGSKTGWGHSSASQAVDLAVAAGVERLVLFHHAPEHTDGDIDELLAEARKRVSRSEATLVVDAAAEGWSLDI